MKNRRMAFLLVSLAALLVASPALAHHGFAGRYDEEHPITVTGTVVEVQFLNPHAFIFFDVTEKGKTTRWQAELGGAAQLNRGEGWTRTTLKVGDKISVGPLAFELSVERPAPAKLIVETSDEEAAAMIMDDEEPVEPVARPQPKPSAVSPPPAQNERPKPPPAAPTPPPDSQQNSADAARNLLNRFKKK